jgi:hypothetical protein
MSLISSVTAAVSGILKPVTSLVDDLHTSDEEKLTLKAQLLTIETGLAAKLLDAEVRVSESQHKLQVAEVQQDDLVTKRWRPFVGYGLGAAIIFNLALPPILTIFKPGYQPPTMDPVLLGIAASLLGVGKLARSWEKVADRKAIKAAASSSRTYSRRLMEPPQATGGAF